MKLFLALLAFTGVFLFAQDVPKPRYFLEFGAGMEVGAGALNGETELVVDAADSSATADSVIVSKLGAFPAYQVRFGAQIHASTIAVAVENASPQAWGEATQWWSVIVDYRYHLNYPQSLRPFVGVNYGFVRWKVGKQGGDVLYNANGPGIETGLSYHWGDWASTLLLRERYLPVRNLSTPANSYSELDSYLHEFVSQIHISVQYLF